MWSLVPLRISHRLHHILTLVLAGCMGSWSAHHSSHPLARSLNCNTCVLTRRSQLCCAPPFYVCMHLFFRSATELCTRAARTTDASTRAMIEQYSAHFVHMALQLQRQRKQQHPPTQLLTPCEPLLLCQHIITCHWPTARRVCVGVSGCSCGCARALTYTAANPFCSYHLLSFS